MWWNMSKEQEISFEEYIEIWFNELGIMTNTTNQNTFELIQQIGLETWFCGYEIGRIG